MAFNFIDETGIIVPDTDILKAEIEAEYKDVFGTDLNVDPETPEGILISAEIASRTGIAKNNAALANQINPNIAGGIFLDALWALTGGARAGATPSTFATPVDVTGVPGTLIPAGSVAATSVGDEFTTLGDVTLDAGGFGSVAFASVKNGAIVAGIASLTTIITSVLGWETVSNPVAATLGTDQQSDISSRRERRGTLGLQGRATPVAVFSNVRAVAGVTSLVFRENITATIITPTPPDNITLAAHSIWACVEGGSDADVAAALLASKSAGSNWNKDNSGTGKTVVLTEAISGQNYTVLFDRPDQIPILYRVTIAASAISNPATIVTEAILAYVNGEIDGEEGLVVGADVSPFEAAGAINIQEPGLTVLNVEVTKAPPAPETFLSTTIPIELFERATVIASSILVIVV